MHNPCFLKTIKITYCKTALSLKIILIFSVNCTYEEEWCGQIGRSSGRAWQILGTNEIQSATGEIFTHSFYTHILLSITLCLGMSSSPYGTHNSRVIITSSSLNATLIYLAAGFSWLCNVCQNIHLLYVFIIIDSVKLFVFNGLSQCQSISYHFGVLYLQ